MNISEKYKAIWIAPERTGSRKVAEILSYYDFKHNGVRICDNIGGFSYSHYTDGIKSFEDFITIMNLRNPYGRAYSIFKNYDEKYPIKSKDNFKRYLTEGLEKSYTFKILLNSTYNKKPDYIIRLENMYEDLLKLPFILDVLNENQLKMLSSHGKPIDEWEQYYDQEGKDIVYHYCKDHFILGGYSK